MLFVYGTIKRDDPSDEKMEFKVKLDVESIDQDSITVEESNQLIINAVNKKYRTKYPSNSTLNNIRSKKDDSEEKIKAVRNAYGHELNDIRYRLQNLENGRIKEFTDADMDGYLATNISALRKEINDLLYKIATESESYTDKMKVKNHFDI
jgi:hypothetical protein